MQVLYGQGVISLLVILMPTVVVFFLYEIHGANVKAGI
jgi:hypothetical protein